MTWHDWIAGFFFAVFLYVFWVIVNEVNDFNRR